jgi:peptidoglycan/xylan/chitin deacetylase (PgdA/CDA1 family)
VLRGAFKSVTEDALTVFLFHEVNERPSAFYATGDLCVTPQSFRRQLEAIRELFDVVAPTELLDGEKVSGRRAIITFDDGAAGVFMHAAPILRELGIPCLVFINAAPVDGELFWPGLVSFLFDKTDFAESLPSAVRRAENRHLLVRVDHVERYLAGKDAGRLRRDAMAHYGDFLDWGQLRELAAVPGIFVGSHLYQHYNARFLPDNELVEQYRANDRRLKALSSYLPLLSYPFGQPGMCFDRRTNRTLEEAGALRLFSSVGTVNRDARARLLDRINVPDACTTPAQLMQLVVRQHVLGSCCPQSLRRLVHRARRRFR